MEERGHAFSFVNRITALEAGVRIRGQYSIPAPVDAFPPALVAEAAGQLAAWAAMAALGFERRPIAGLAETIELLAPVRPGQLLALAAELQSVDPDAVDYHASVHVDGVPVLRLQHCVGPMISVGELDCPDRLRERFGVLIGQGESNRFDGLPAMALEETRHQFGQWARAQLRVPSGAPFFNDHFPRRAVFPGSLLMHINLELAAALARQLPEPGPGWQWVPRSISNMKLRAFIPPGQVLEIGATLDGLSERAATVVVETRLAKRVVSGARVHLVPEARS